MTDISILFYLDKKFCEECKMDKEKAWMKYTADRSLMATNGHNPYLEKTDDIRNTIQQVFNLENIDFTWIPIHGGMSDDSTMGFTTGNYTRIYTSNGKEVKQIGKYVSIWKKIDGLWKIVFDMGN